MSSRGLVRTWLCFVVALSWFHSTGVAATWRVYTGPHMVMLSDAGEGLARQRLEKLELFRAAMAAYQGESAISRLPTRLILFRNDAEFDRVKIRQNGKAPEIDGFYIPDRFENLIAVNAEDDARLDGHVVQHEFVHLLCRAQHSSWPFWLNEGIAECLSTAQIKSDRVQLGTPPKESMLALSRLRLLTVNEVIDGTQKRLRGKSQEYGQAFYAESWLLTHMLIFNANPEIAKHSDSFLRRITDGKSSEAALEESFGWSMEKLAKEMTYYRDHGRFAVLKLTMTNAVQPTIEVRPAAAVELKHWLGRWFLAEGRTNEAAQEFQTAAQAAPGTAQSELGLGLLKQRLGQTSESISHFRAARALDSTAYEIPFRLALSLILSERHSETSTGKVSNEFLQEICSLLEECLRLRPDFVPAFDLLGRARHEQGNLQKATDALVKAITLATFEDSTRLELARVLRDGKRPDLARVQFQLVASNPRNKLAATEAAADLARMDSKPEPAPK